MDILIKNLELPKSCSVCPLCEFGMDYKENPYETCRATGKVSVGIRVKGRKDDCPLIELAEHGDLIDRNILAMALVAETEMVIKSTIAPSVKPEVLYELKNVGNMIFEQPVVLPKSGL